MDDWTPVVVLLIEELMKGEYGTIAIPRQYFKSVEGYGVDIEWDSDFCRLSLKKLETASD